MKIIVIPILMLLIATQAFSKWVMLLDFKWNKDYIAQNLCENKAKPMLKCEGKCHLKKMMAEEEQDTNPRTITNEKKQNENFSGLHLMFF